MATMKMLRIIVAVAALFAVLWGVACCAVRPTNAHDWYPPHCCSGHDCRAIEAADVTMTPAGFLIKENGETVPYSSDKIRRTPPEGGGLYHRCSVGGTPQGATICLYIPNWGT